MPKFSIIIPVPMSENWERAVAAAGGDYLAIIGDDDGIITLE